MKTNKFARDFKLRNEWQREQLLAQVWCDYCGAGDLGVEEPYEYEVNGVIYLEGLCAKCGREVVSTVDESLMEEE